MSKEGAKTAASFTWVALSWISRIGSPYSTCGISLPYALCFSETSISKEEKEQLKLALAKAEEDKLRLKEQVDKEVAARMKEKVDSKYNPDISLA